MVNVIVGIKLMKSDCEKCNYSNLIFTVMNTTGGVVRDIKCGKYNLPLPVDGLCWCRTPFLYKNLQEVNDDD